MHIRPVNHGDRHAIRSFLEGLSSDSLGFRFFGAPSLEWVTKWSVDVDYADRYGLVATVGLDRCIVAHGAYVRTASDRAEVAFVVADAWQGQGIATIMLAHLAAAARQHAIVRFTAEVMPANHRMVQVFRDSGFPIEVRADRDVIEVEMPTSLSQDGRRRFQSRERTAAIAAVRSCPQRSRHGSPEGRSPVQESHRQRA